MKSLFSSSVALTFLITSIVSAQEIPKVSDPRLVVELFAAAPDIVHPISCDFDAKGRLLVIESHTHFAPQGYKGPKFDRIQAFDVSKPGKPTTFFEGTRHTMDLAVHPDGSVYIATRNEILRLRDTKGTGVADEKTRIVFLDTKGDYPHNGLSRVCIDSKGDLNFGMGENLGAKYTLIGSDGVKFSGEGDGGHIFHCSADGKKLHRVATGFWNPFGNCRDIYGRLFCVDNDPDQMPPCRMLHVVEGGDYGFTFRYGRSGKHPFQSWHGQLPGTLPMMTGVGEAPCEILSYESDGLPAEYRGQLLVTSWADHRVERYAVKPHGASFKAERLPFVQGGSNFRPTGMCVAPDGSIYVCDWVLSNYNLHGKGAIWRIRQKDAPKVDRPDDPKKAIFSMHRPLRESAAWRLASNEQDREFLMKQWGHSDVRVRATAIGTVWGSEKEHDAVVENDPDQGLKEIVIKRIVERYFWALGGGGHPANRFCNEKYPGTVRAEAIMNLDGNGMNDEDLLFRLVADKDPFLRHAAIRWVSSGRNLPFLRNFNLKDDRESSQRIAHFLIHRRIFSEPDLVGIARYVSKKTDGRTAAEYAAMYLRDSNESTSFLAAKWIADEKLIACRKDIENAMADSKLSVRMYMACSTALARLDGQPVNEQSLTDYFAKRLADDATPPALRAMLLRQVPATHSKLTFDLLGKLLKTDDAALKFEAVRALVDHPNGNRHKLLLEVFRNPKLGDSTRAFATLGLGAEAEKELAVIAKDETSPFRADALRALNGERGIEKDRPAAKDLDTWTKRLEGKADVDAGARIFFHPKLGGCYKCHRIDGRGQDVGPDLSSIGRTDRRHLLESILQPSNTVAPHYVAWHLETADGKVRNGMLVHTNLDEYTYLDAKGDRFKVRTGDIVDQRPLTTSIMPDGLVDRMTDQEVRDLLAYLQTRK